MLVDMPLSVKCREANLVCCLLPSAPCSSYSKYALFTQCVMSLLPFLRRPPANDWAAILRPDSRTSSPTHFTEQ